MLSVIYPEDGGFFQPCALVLGGFDGIHLGHKSLLDRAREFGLPVVLTTIAGGKKGGELFTASERERVFSELGADGVFVFPFTEELRETCARDFLQSLFSRCTPRVVVCGEDFRFGKDAAGDSAFLKKCAPCPVEVLLLKQVDGQKISSTNLKALLAAGEMSALNRLLAYPYFLEGTVEHGRRVGSGVLGFPTVNLTLSPEKAPPKEGVYGGYAVTDFGRTKCIFNYGARPTFHVAEKKAEAFLLDFDGDLYDSRVRIYPEEYFRPVTAFPSAEELRRQLERDVQRVKNRRNV